MLSTNADRLVGPLADLRDVFPSGGRKKAGIHYEHLAIADNDRSVAARKAVKVIAMFNLVDTGGELRHLPLRLRRHRGRAPEP